MGFPLTGAAALLSLLGSSKNLTSSKARLCRKLGINVQHLMLLAHSLNDLEPLLEIKETTLRLQKKLDLLDAAAIYRDAKGPGRIEVLEFIDSTNTRMLQRSSNLISGDALLAEIQTAGRGRRNSRWFSGIAKNVTLSVCWFFDENCHLQGLSSAAGAAVAAALEQQGFAGIEVKWPNDLFFKNKKLGGILIETVPHEGQTMAVTGIGINLLQRGIPDLKKNIVALEECRPGTTPDRNQICTVLISAIRRACAEFASGGLAPFLPELKTRDYLYGKKIALEDEVHHHLEGRACGIDSGGALQLDTGPQIISVTTGHIELLPATDTDA